MNRRIFLASAACASAASWVSLPTFAQTGELTLDLHAAAPGRTVPANFTGLSYELAQLTEPAFFSAEHRDLIALFRQLSPSGVLRLGGNSSEFCWFQATPSTPAPQLHVPTGDINANYMPHRLFPIQPQAVDALAGFLQATGWKVIYGVNFGNSTPERAAVEAAYAAKVLGSHLLYFQIGNEPDLYRTASNGTRPAGWGFADYAREWIQFADAITAAVPNARFAGPDVGSSSDWITRFGEEVAPKLGSRLAALTGHYYAMGPPNDPKVNIARLLAGNPKVASDTVTDVQAADAHGVSYRMTEGNSCYRGGKPGMSDAFAASLWTADYLLTLASLGCAGTNMHGGDSRFLAASVGDHFPGLEVAKTPQSLRHGFYTPIRSEQGQTALAMPVFYGMLLAQQFAGATFLETSFKLPGNANVYAARKGNETLVAVINKDATQPVSLSIRGGKSAASALRLTGPALDATTGITFGGAAVDTAAGWHPAPEPVKAAGGLVRATVPAGSALLLRLS